MRLFAVVFFLLTVSGFSCTFGSDELDGFTYNELPNPDVEVRNLADPLGMPKTAAEMVSRFNADFLTFLTSRNPETWNRLMEVVDQNAYIETCMEAYSLKMDQFHKWMTYLGKYYLEVGLTSSVITDQSSSTVSTELIYRTEVRGGAKGADKWSMTAEFDSDKGYFVVNALHMLSECKGIPKSPPLEPAIPAETFINYLKNKLVNDIFLDNAVRYKSAYESMYEYLNARAYISVCDVGKMTTNQFVEYWNKRYGKVTVYKDHFFNVTKNKNDWHVDFAVTYQGEPGKFFRDRYRFTVQKYTNMFVEYFENFMDWTIFAVKQKCTETITQMSKSDESLVLMALASRRWDQLFVPGLRWDTREAFLEMFSGSSFNGYACGSTKWTSLAEFKIWLQNMQRFFQSSVPIETKVYAYKDQKIGFYIRNQMTGNDNVTTRNMNYYEGYYENSRWHLNHCGFSCNE